jgi:hypothetical protein
MLIAFAVFFLILVLYWYFLLRCIRTKMKNSVLTLMAVSRDSGDDRIR